MFKLSRELQNKIIKIVNDTPLPDPHLEYTLRFNTMVHFAEVGIKTKNPESKPCVILPIDKKPDGPFMNSCTLFHCNYAKLPTSFTNFVGELITNINRGLKNS